MTRHDPKRTAMVKASQQPRSTVYRNTKNGPQAVSASALRKSEPVALKRKPQKFQGDNVEEWLYATAEESLGSTIKYGVKSNKEYPRVPQWRSHRRLAEFIAGKLVCLARKNLRLVQDGLAAYAKFVQADSRMMLTPQTNPHLLQTWMKFVNKLEIDHLELRYIAFTVEGQKGDLKEQCQRLNLTWPIKEVTWVKASNQENRGAKRNLAIDVVYKSRGCSVFRFVMAMATISQLWPVTPDASSQAGHEADEEQGITCSECNTSLPSVLPGISEGGVAVNSAALDGQPLQAVYMFFNLKRQSKPFWCCHFLENDPKPSLKKIHRVENTQSIFVMARRGRANEEVIKLLGMQTTSGHGGCWLYLDRKEYTNLLSKASGD